MKLSVLDRLSKAKENKKKAITIGENLAPYISRATRTKVGVVIYLSENVQVSKASTLDTIMLEQKVRVESDSDSNQEEYVYNSDANETPLQDKKHITYRVDTSKMDDAERMRRTKERIARQQNEKRILMEKEKNAGWRKYAEIEDVEGTSPEYEDELEL